MPETTKPDDTHADQKVGDFGCTVNIRTNQKTVYEELCQDCMDELFSVRADIMRNKKDG